MLQIYNINTQKGPIPTIKKTRHPLTYFHLQHNDNIKKIQYQIIFDYSPNYSTQQLTNSLYYLQSISKHYIIGYRQQTEKYWLFITLKKRISSKIIKSNIEDNGLNNNNIVISSRVSTAPNIIGHIKDNCTRIQTYGILTFKGKALK